MGVFSSSRIRSEYGVQDLAIGIRHLKQDPPGCNSTTKQKPPFHHVYWCNFWTNLMTKSFFSLDLGCPNTVPSKGPYIKITNLEYIKQNKKTLLDKISTTFRRRTFSYICVSCYLKKNYIPICNSQSDCQTIVIAPSCCVRKEFNVDSHDWMVYKRFPDCNCPFELYSAYFVIMTKIFLA